jgi:pyridoxamine 5'-phosphate oxidase
VLLVEPLELFSAWYARAEAEEKRAQNMALATSSSGRPSVRTVELVRHDDRGFVFYTGAESRKGRDLAANPRAALCFYWPETNRQVRIEGRVEAARLDEEEARLADAADARQGEPVADRRDLEARVAELRERFGDDAPPVPSDWAAFRVVPDAFEFWEYRADKLHDRFRFRLDPDGWQVERLFP